MALDDIKKAILAEAEKEVKIIETEGEKKIADVNDVWTKKIEEKKQEIVASGQRKANQKVQQTQFKLQSNAQAEVLNQKQRVINKVYKLALQKLGELDDQGYVDLLSGLIAKLPEDEGELISVMEKESLLKKALQKSEKEYTVATETTTGNGGFVFKSEKVEIDNTFATLINNSKEQTSLLVSDKLFSVQE